MSKTIEPTVNTAFECTIDKPESVDDVIHIHGEHLSVREAEKLGMVKIERGRNGKPKKDGNGIIKYAKVSAH